MVGFILFYFIFSDSVRLAVADVALEGAMADEIEELWPKINSTGKRKGPKQTELRHGSVL